MEWVQVVLGIVGAGGALLAAWYARLGLLKHSRWRKEDRKDRVVALLKESHNEITHAMDDAQHGRTMGTLRSVEALMADVGYGDLTRKCREAVEKVYSVCSEYRSRGLNAWNSIGGEVGMNLARSWMEACAALEVIEDVAFGTNARGRVSPPRLRPHHMESLHRSFTGGRDGPPTPEVDALEEEMRERGWLEE